MSLADERETLKFLAYGDPGTGKTTGLASIAKRGKLYVVEAEAGLKAKPLRDFGIDPERIEPYRKITYNDLDALFWEIKEELEDEPDAAAGIDFDSMTEISQLLLGLIVDKEQGKIIAKAENAGLDTSDIDPFFRDISYWGTLTEQVRRLIRSYKTLPIHLGFSALVRRDVDKNTGKVMYGPAVNPAIQNDLMGAVDIIAFCRTDGVWPKGYEVAGRDGFDVMVADMRRTDTHHAKDRFHATPRLLVNPTFDRVIDYVYGDLTLDSDEQMKAYRELRAERRSAAKDAAEERKARKAGAGRGVNKRASGQTPAAGATGRTAAAKRRAAEALEANSADGDDGGDAASDDES